MIQFFRFEKDSAVEAVYSVISGRESVKFFVKRAVKLVLFIYSTLFLAVALPFVETPFEPVYFIGGFATVIFAVRYINHIVGYRRFKGGSLKIKSDGVTLKGVDSEVAVPAGDIRYIEHNILGNVVVRCEKTSFSFPSVLLNPDEREILLASFVDMAPGRTRIYRKVWEFIDAVVVALVLAVHIIQYVVQAYFIPTGSMEDTLIVGDHLFVEKLTYGPIIPQMAGMDGPIHLDFLGVRDVQRGDIVIFRPPHEQDKDYIKRCIGVPGDKLSIRGGHVYINGEKLNEPYVKGLTFDDPETSRIQGVVPEGKLVVLGDNRENSMDGRYFGYLDIAKIKGRAFVLYWNTDQVFNLDFSRLGLIR